MPNLMNPTIAELLQDFVPFLFFDPTEQFFPAVAEEVLVHQGKENWNKLQTHQRGTAVLITPLTASSYASGDVKAGVDDPSGAPLTFDSTPPTGIGQPFAFDSSAQDMFLDCAGWDDSVTEVQPGGTPYTTGSVEYLQQLFSGLGNAMNSAIQVSTPSPVPTFGIPRSNAPTIYAELDWAGRYPVIDQERVDQIGGNADFPNTITGDKNQPGPLSALNNYLSLTYYLFYPAMEISTAGPANPDVNRIREGQWEAITIFLKGDPDFGVTDHQGRPDFPFTILNDPVKGIFARGLTPRFLAYSQGYSLNDDSFNPLAAEVRLWPSPNNPSNLPVGVLGTHPFAFVTAGTHRNFFAIDATVNPGTSSPNAALNTTGAALMGAAGSAMGICAGVLLATPPPANAGAFVVCVVIAAILFLIGLILFILSFLFPDTTPSTETVQTSQPGSDVARDDGPAAIPPVGGTVTSNASSVTGPTLRLISQFSFDPTPPITTYPLPSPLPATGAIEMPSWWNFPGRWGVRITPLAAGKWDSGSRRTDPFGRTRAYWNAFQLVQFVTASGGTITL